MSWSRPTLRLRTRITLRVCTILLLVLVAESEPLIGGLKGLRPADDVQDHAERLRERTGVEYGVVMNLNRIRLSHPNPSQIGAQFVGGNDADSFRGLA